MQLELEIEAAFGSISRMEAGKVNPTKETLLRIATVLSLSDRELDYLIGPSSSPATINEIDAAQKEVKEYFAKKGVMAYLVDDRYRLIAFSDSFAKLFRVKDERIKEEVILKTLPELLLDESYIVSQFFQADLEHNLELLLGRFQNEMGFMHDDPYYQKIMNLITNHKQANMIWEKISSNNKSLYARGDRVVHFNVLGQKFEMHYANEPLQKYKRFDIVEYIPNNWFVKMFWHLF